MEDTKAQESDKITYLDDFYSNFSLFKFYYVRYFCLMFIMTAINICCFSNYIFVTEAVNYRCADKRFENNTCGSLNDSEVCSEWIYDNPHSFVAEFKLACQDWKRGLLGSAYNLGFGVGLFITGTLSDRIGRRTTMVLTGTLGAILGASRTLITNYWIYISMEFIQAAIGDIYCTVYILTVEMFSNKKRIVAITVVNLGISLGYTILASLAWAIPYWRHLLLTIYGPLSLITLYYYYFMIDESPRWLLSKNRKEDAIVVLRNTAKTSDVTLDEDALKHLANEEEGGRLRVFDLIKMTLTSSVLFKRFLLAFVWWTSSTFINHGLKANAVELPGNKYLSFMLLTPADVTAKFLLAFIVINFRRKLPLAITLFCSAILCTGQIYIPAEVNWLPPLLFFGGKVMSTIFLYITYLFSVELFPTYTRNSLVGLCSGLGRFGSALAPMTPLLAQYWEGLPLLTFGLVSLFAGIVTLFAPDLDSEPLPDNVMQAEVLGCKDSSMLGEYI